MTTFICPECGNPMVFSRDFRSEGCVLLERCPVCRAYVELTSENIASKPERRTSKKNCDTRFEEEPKN